MCDRTIERYIDPEIPRASDTTHAIYSYTLLCKEDANILGVACVKPAVRFKNTSLCAQHTKSGVDALYFCVNPHFGGCVWCMYGFN